jgi:hypothetical protein
MANMIERLINLTVNNSEANVALNKTATNLDKVDKNTTKVTQSTKTMTKETHSLTEATVKNGGAMGLLNDLTGGLAMTFKDASEAMEIAGVSLNSFKGIMLATGIGALVLAVGYLAENWKELSDSITGAADAQNKYNVAMAKTEEQRRSIANITSKEITNLEYEREQLIKQGASKKELAAIDEKIFNAKVNQNQVNQESYKQELIIQNELIDKDKARNAIINEGKSLTKDLTQARNDLAKQEKGSMGEDTFKRVIYRLEEEVKVNKEKLDIYDATNENIKKRKELQDKYYETERNGTSLLTEKQKTYNAELTKARDLADAKEAARISKLAALIAANNKKLLELDDDTIIKKLNRQEQYALKELDDLNASEKAKNDIRSYYERLRQEEYSKGRKADAEADKKAFDDSVTKMANQFQMQLDLQQIANDAKLESWMEYWDDVTMVSETAQNFLSILQDESLIKSKTVRDAMLLLEKGLAIANVWITEAQSSAMAKANAAAIPLFINTYPGGPSVPNPAKPLAEASAVRTVVANKINAGIATAAILAQTLASFSKSSGGSSGGAGGGTGAGPQAQFNIVGSSGQNQLAAAIGARQNQPVNAFVVGSDVSTQQALDRNRVTNATFL